jgi:hypothetical protein
MAYRQYLYATVFIEAGNEIRVNSSGIGTV